MTWLPFRSRPVAVAPAGRGAGQGESLQLVAHRPLRDVGAAAQATRRSLVAALAAELHLLKQRDRMQRDALAWEQEAVGLLEGGDAALARGALECAVSLTTAAAALASPIALAQRTTRRLQEQMERLRHDARAGVADAQER